MAIETYDGILEMSDRCELAFSKDLASNSGVVA